MAKGLSLHIGLNRVNPDHYAGWAGPLGACEADAVSMEAIAALAGYTTRKLLTEAATRAAVSGAILEAADQLAAGDIFFLSYAGHGGQVPDTNGDESDDADETWCLFDGQLIDDELLQLWTRFASGVRVLVLSDSCHSGTVTRALRDGNLQADSSDLRSFGIDKPVFRFMPQDVAIRTYMANRDMYDQLGASVPADTGTPAATVRLISGCQDDQTSADGPFNGLFTGTLLKVWKDGPFAGDYEGFHAAIVRRMPQSQQPNHFVFGPSAPAFDRQRPFTI